MDDEDTVHMITGAEHVLEVLEELAGRWGRAMIEQAEKPSLFTAGRAEGYVQAFQILLGNASHAEALKEIKETARAKLGKETPDVRNTHSH